MDLFECHSSLSFVIVRCSELIRVCALQTAFHWVVLGVAFDKISVVLNTCLFCVCVWCVCLCVCVCMCACAESGWFQCDQHWWRQSAVPLCRDGQVMGHHPTVPAWSAVQGLHCLFFSSSLPYLPCGWVVDLFLLFVYACHTFLCLLLLCTVHCMLGNEYFACLSWEVFHCWIYCILYYYFNFVLLFQIGTQIQQQRPELPTVTHLACV